MGTKKEFTIEEVRDIRSGKSTPKDLSLYYNVSVDSIRKIIRRDTYMDIPALQTRAEEIKDVYLFEMGDK